MFLMPQMLLNTYIISYYDNMSNKSLEYVST